MNDTSYERFLIYLGAIIAVTAVFFCTALSAHAATNISATTTDHWAWNDAIGWIDLFNTNSVMVNSFQLTGYASSSAGDISLDCATTRIGDWCATSNYKVWNDGFGNLSGWGWNDAYGWISFCGGLSTPDCPGIVNYRVRIDPFTGVFTDGGLLRNFAWNDAIGWISFNCENQGSSYCGSVSDHKVVTSWFATSTIGWLDSATFDIGVASGAQLNSFVWQGVLPSPANGAAIRFQFATANSSSGPWTYLGPDGTENTYYSNTVPGVSTRIDYAVHGTTRFYRYRIFLSSDQAQRKSPRVDDVLVNWSL